MSYAASRNTPTHRSCKHGCGKWVRRDADQCPFCRGKNPGSLSARWVTAAGLLAAAVAGYGVISYYR